MSRCTSCRVASLWIEGEVDEEFVKPDDRALTLAVFLEEDDAQLGEAGEFLVDVLHVPVNDPCGLVDRVTSIYLRLQAEVKWTIS